MVGRQGSIAAILTGSELARRFLGGRDPIWWMETRNPGHPDYVRKLGNELGVGSLDGLTAGCRDSKGSLSAVRTNRQHSYAEYGILSIVSDHRGDTFRAVYTLRLGERVFVLHAFQKKSKRGAATPQAELEMIKRRLKRAMAISEAGV